MRSATSMAIVTVITGAVLFAIAVFGSQGGSQQDCAECHTPGSEQGDYVLEPPDVFAVAPEGISAGDPFQVLVIASDPSDYDIASPSSSIDVSGLPGSEVLGDGTILLEGNGTSWTGIFRVRAGSDSGLVSITMTYTAHHDHARSDYPDLSTSRIVKMVPVQVGPSEETEDMPAKESPLGTVVMVLAISSIVWWRSWKRDRRNP